MEFFYYARSLVVICLVLAVVRGRLGLRRSDLFSIYGWFVFRKLCLSSFDHWYTQHSRNLFGIRPRGAAHGHINTKLRTTTPFLAFFHLSTPSISLPKPFSINSRVVSPANAAQVRWNSSFKTCLFQCIFVLLNIVCVYLARFPHPSAPKYFNNSL